MNKNTTIELKNNLKMPVLGLGTWNLTGEFCKKVIKTALELSYRHIDTAEIYGNEKEIGQAIKDFPREKLFIVSKVWPGSIDFSFVPQSLWPVGLTLNKISKSCENSLKRLGTNYIDLYLIHWPKLGMNLKKACIGFKKLYEQGKIKAFGVSNFSIKLLEKIIPISEKVGIPICVNQVEFHPFLYQKKLLDYCKSKGIVITAYTPLAKGKVKISKTLNEIAKKYNKTPIQVDLRWLIQKGTNPIPKASSVEHLKENIDIFDFNLKKEDVKRIDFINVKERIVKPILHRFDD